MCTCAAKSTYYLIHVIGCKYGILYTIYTFMGIIKKKKMLMGI